jgi:putative PIN family toxin of toxin-antitoxin system
MKKVLVVDTSVFASALIGETGASREILRRCLTGQYQPLMGTSLFHEYESLLHRASMLKKCPLSAGQREDLFNAFMSVCRWIHIYYLWRPNLKDEDDNHVLELAIAGNAVVIVTKNTKDFKNGQLLFAGIHILKPEQLLKEEGA